MKAQTQDLVSRFFFDTAKVSFAVLVIGIIAKGAFTFEDLFWGLSLTLFLFVFGGTISNWKVRHANG